MLISHHQYAGRNCDMKIANRSFDSVAVSRYFGRARANHNFNHKVLEVA
jgi:hypothetical protein